MMNRRFVPLAKAFHELRNRIAIFVELPHESFSKPQLKAKLAEIGRIAGDDSSEKGGGR